MREVLITLIGLVVIAALVGALGIQRAAADREDRITAVHRALQTLEHVTQERADLRTAHQHYLHFDYPYPADPDPDWFPAGLPLNPFAARHPWVDMAPLGDLEVHPPDPVLYRPEQAAFWFNPNLGIYRARVAPGTSRQMLEDYNRANGVTLRTLPRDPSPDREPRPLPPGADPLVDTRPPPEPEPAAPDVETQQVQTSTPIYIRNSDGELELLDLSPKKPAERRTLENRGR